MEIEKFILEGRAQPDFEGFLDNIRGIRRPERVPFAEFLIDPEIIEEISRRYLGEKGAVFPDDEKAYLKRGVSCFYRLGYDYALFVDIPGLTLHFPGRERVGKDTAFFSRRERKWVEEGQGLLSSWDDFEEYPWPEVDRFDFSLYEYLTSLIPEGMGLLVNACGGIFEVVSENLIGFAGLSYLLYDNFALVEATFERVGEIILHFYQQILNLPGVRGVFQGDDWGYKTSTFLSPTLLRKLVLPWHKKLATLCHERDKCYFLHSCGMVLPLMEDLLREVKIDAFHSFQEEVIPVTTFAEKYGHRVGILGGIDVDALVRFEEENLRRYVRSILEHCFPNGRYALGSGNSIANYVPVEKYLIMLDEGLSFS